MSSLRSTDLRPPALLAGLAYALAVTLVATQADSDPVGAHYDGFNRILTVALALLTGSAVMVRARLARAGLPGRGAATALAVGFGLMALGSAVEFWGALIAGEPTEKTAARLGEADSFVGSAIGWALFLLGSVTFTVAAVALSRRVARWPRAGRAAAPAIVAVALLNIAAGWLWAVSPLAAAVPGAALAFAWLTVASSVESATRPESARAGRPPATSTAAG